MTKLFHLKSGKRVYIHNKDDWNRKKFERLTNNELLEIIQNMKKRQTVSLKRYLIDYLIDMGPPPHV